MLSKPIHKLLFYGARFHAVHFYSYPEIFISLESIFLKIKIYCNEIYICSILVDIMLCLCNVQKGNEYRHTYLDFGNTTYDVQLGSH